MYGKLYRKFWQLRPGSTVQKIYSDVSTIQQLERISQAQLNQFQFDEMRRLLIHAYEHVPFYRTRMVDAGFDPHQLNSLKEISQLPFLTKDDIRNNSEKLVANGYDINQLTKNATGGSTGKPLKFYQDNQYTIFNRAKKFNQRRWYGYEVGDKIAYLWGARRDTKSKGFRQQLRQTLRREHWVNAFDLTPQQMRDFKRLLDDWQPKLLVAYPSALQAFSHYLLQNGLSVTSPGAIECSAEKLQPAQRALFEELFTCPIYDSYGSREFGVVAAQCEAQQGLHVMANGFYVEIVKDGQPAQPGETGEIVITCFGNYAMPFVRYATGDLGRLSLEPCTCGRNWPCLSEVIGRTNSVVTTPDGRVVHGAFFSKFFYNRSGVIQYRVHQTALDQLHIMLKCDDQFSSQQALALQQEISSDLGHQINVVVQIVPDIAPLPSGKMAYLISDVPVDFTQRVSTP
ncbi:MAG: phenylacetate--CoA ligase family protein [Anaerolineae bacterium]|nr:phenylacetate--CoA ligase family protein [Anaerolineae bacterium]